VCHQTVSLTARTLEEAGIATVVIGAAWDIVTTCKVPRYLHNDLPLGNPLGKPYDRAAQRASVWRALELVETAGEPVAARGPLRWSGNDQWKDNYMRTDDHEGLRRLGEENRARRKAEIEAGLRRPG